ncbi:Phenylalanine--tRNA ligase beta subunit [Acropora cervicornis]|uniref:Phenylalanine--tRNA ligase beta subunit n=1 Tax=Acropora cervicornis TaxID=6130 RepID=A0AAD9UUV1_ACRCE|nr:Phenylalanine--tRNA ligase beta subunit [Acropora cervicornis]
MIRFVCLFFGPRVRIRRILSFPEQNSDIIHECDIIEDVAISYGFNNVVKTIPPTNTIANQVIR